MDSIRSIIGGVIALVAFGYLIYYLYLAFKQEKGNRKGLVARAFVGFFVITIVAGMILPGPTEEEIAQKEAEEQAEKEKIVEEKEKKKEAQRKKDEEKQKIKNISLAEDITNEKIEQVIAQVIPKSKIEEVHYTDITHHVLLKLKGDPYEHVLLEKSIKVLEVLTKQGYEGDTSFFWIVPAMDKHANSIETKGLGFTVQGEDAMKINYERYIPPYLKELVEGEGYYISHIIKPIKTKVK